MKKFETSIRNFTSFSVLTSINFFSSFQVLSPFYLLSEVLCILSLLDMSLTGPEMNTESFLSLRTFKKFFVFVSLVKVFSLFSFSVFCIFISLYFVNCEMLYICVMSRIHT